MAIDLKPNNEWMASYLKLVNFKEKHGHLFVPYKEGKPPHPLMVKLGADWQALNLVIFDFTYP